MTPKPYRECPRFDKCSVNNCPLGEAYPANVVDEGDKEQKCTLEKQVRFRIGSKYPDILKYQGLTIREWTGRQNFDKLTEPEKEAIRQRAKVLVAGLKNSICLSSQSKRTEKGVKAGQG